MGDPEDEKARQASQFPAEQIPAVMDLDERPPIQRHDGSLYNIRGPNDPLFFPQLGEKQTGSSSLPEDDKGRQASQFPAEQIAALDLDERPAIQRHDGSLCNIRGPNDPLFFPQPGKKRTRSFWLREQDKARGASQFPAVQIPAIDLAERPPIQLNDCSLHNIRGPNDPLFLPLPVEKQTGSSSLPGLPPANSNLMGYKCTFCKGYMSTTDPTEPIIYLPCQHPVHKSCFDFLTSRESYILRHKSGSKSD